MRVAPAHRGAAGRSCLLLLHPLFVYGAVAIVYAPRPRRACLEFQDGSRLGLWKDTRSLVGASGRDAGLLHTQTCSGCMRSARRRQVGLHVDIDATIGARRRETGPTTMMSACSYYYRIGSLALPWPVLSFPVAELHVCSGADQGPT